MKKIITDKIGTLTSKIHDTKSKFLISEERYNFIKKIHYYTSEDGIHGFFPVYRDDNINNEIFKDSFYHDFKKTHLEKLNTKLISHKHNLQIMTLEFTDKEVINSIVCKYDEDNQKIVVIKIKTTKDTYFIGDRLLLSKTLPKIVKENHFIPGMKLSFTQDNNMIYLSSLQAYFEHDDNYHKYILTTSHTDYISILLKFYLNVEKILFKIIKFFFVIFLFLATILYLLTCTMTFSGGDILVEERHLLFDKIKIHTDENGFMHVRAENLEDGYFGIGFTHAKERLWQMEFLRRLSRGKLSEIFGEKTLEIDRFIKSIGLNYISEKNSEYFMYNSEYFKTFQRYLDGINYYATYYPLPIEFKLTFTNNFKYWELADSVAIFNFVHFSLSKDWQSEIWQRYIEDNLGKEFADFIISFRDMNHPFSNESVITDDELVDLNMHKHRKKSDEAIRLEREKAEKIAKQEMKRIQLEKEKEMKKKIDEHDNEQETIEENGNNLNIDNNKVENLSGSNDLIDNFSIDGASNSWAISGKHTSSGSSILTNDPHLPNSAPNSLFIMKLYLPDNIISGATYPGFPFFLIGSNKDISWGLTTANSDIVDICEEKIEDNFYFYDGKKIKLVETEEFIDIKGQPQEKIVLKWTRNGPIINKIAKQFTSLNINLSYEIPLSIKIFTYLHEFTSFSFYFKANFASDPKIIIDESDKFMSSNFHYVWATKNDIGYIPLGKFYVKNYKNRFCKGYSSKDEATKILKKIDLPKIKNPKKGFIATANNRFVNFNFTSSVSGCNYHVRAFRIREMIENKIKNLEKFDVRDNIMMIQDQKDSLASVVLPMILDIFERNAKKFNFNNEIVQNYLSQLRNWNFVMDKNSTEATIYSVLEYNLGRHLISGKIPEASAKGIIDNFPYWNFISGIITKIHSEEEIEMIQCAGLTGSKNCEKYIFSVFSNLDIYLKDFKDGNRIKKWGEVLTNSFPHNSFENVPILGKIFSRQISTGGNRNTVNYARVQFSNPKKPFVSTSSGTVKFICDMSDPTRPYIISSTGNSGNLFSKFYDNFLDKNINGDLIKFNNIDFDKIEKADRNTILIKPLHPISQEKDQMIERSDEMNHINSRNTIKS